MAAAEAGATKLSLPFGELFVKIIFRIIASVLVATGFTSLLPDFFDVSGNLQAAAWVFFAVVAYGGLQHIGEQSKCPHCKEAIRKDATKCKHCGSEI